MQTHKVRIINTHYVNKHHLIIWDIKFIDKSSSKFGQTKRVAYRADDLASALLGRNGVKITPQQAITFNHQIKGKQKKISFQAQVSNIGAISSLSEEDLSNLNNGMQKYPFAQVFDAINQGQI